MAWNRDRLEDVARERLGDARLVVVANREPFIHEFAGDVVVCNRPASGLCTALDPVMRKSGGVWIAWEPGGDPDEDDLRHQVPAEEPRFTLRQVALTTGEVRRYYHGFANRALWPLCHYFVDRCSFDAAEWRQYVQVNERFADAVAEEARPDDLVWVHDYQLALVPGMIRRRAPGASIGFFLHIPFPAADVFRILPWARTVLRGLLGADHIGFHTTDYAQHFLTCAERLLGCDVDFTAGQVEIDGRTVRVGAHPLGIDVAEQERLGRELEAAYRRLKKLSARLVVAQERERTLISRELHDQLGQTLTGMVIHLHAAQRAATPEAIPMPIADMRVVTRIAREEDRRAADAESTRLPTPVLAVGSAFRAFNQAQLRGGAEVDMVAARRGIESALRGLSPPGSFDDALLSLRALQARHFLDAVAHWEATGETSEELEGLGGDFVGRICSVGWRSISV